MRHLILPALALGLLAGCAHDEPLPPADAMPPEAASVAPEGRFVLTGIRQPVVATISAQGVQGPDFNLGRYPGQGGAIAWRGKAFGRDVNLTVNADAADGLVGRMPYSLQVNPGQEGLVANGLILGVPSTVSIGKARINGAFGRCGYDVRFQGQAYVGPRSCGGTPQQVGVTLPPILNTWSDAEVATVLSLLMSGR